MQRIVLATLLGCLVGAADAQTPSSLNVAGDEVVMRTAARGVQVYECRAAADGALAWAFREPRAELFVGEQRIGQHFAGPSWQHVDGSRITGKVVTNVPAQTPDDIPWLRLAIASRSGDGALGGVMAVQRINTHGGVLTGACPEVGGLSEVPYTADYIMLRAAS